MPIPSVPSPLQSILAAKTYNAAWFPGSTIELQIQAAINAAVVDGALYVFVPANMLPYNASLVAFNNSIRMLRENGPGGDEYDIRAYGAAVNGSTDDTTAWLAVIAAANSTNGTILHSGGTSLISSTITFPIDSFVSLIGVGGATIKATGAAFGPMLKWSSTPGGFGSRYGAMRDIIVDGNRIATVGLEVGELVQREWENVAIRNNTSVGLKVLGAQNCIFTNVNCEENGSNGSFDCQLLIDLGAGNNFYVNCEFAVTQDVVARGAYNVIIRQSGASPAGGFNVPSLQVFIRCNLERTSTTHIAQLYHHAGRNNQFIACTISATATTDAVKADATDTVAVGNLLHFIKCYFNGVAQTSNNCFNLTGVAPLILDNCLIENFLRGVRLDDSSYVHVNEPTTFTVGTQVVPTGAKTISQLATGGRAYNVAAVPTGVPVFQVAGTSNILYDSIHNMLWIFNGAWRGIALDPGFTLPTYGVNVAIDMSQGTFFQIVVSNGVAFTINNPTNGTPGKEVVLDFFNNSGGAMGAVTFSANWKLAGAFVAPATANHRLYRFVFDPLASDLHELSRSAADVAH